MKAILDEQRERFSEDNEVTTVAFVIEHLVEASEKENLPDYYAKLGEKNLGNFRTI